MKDKLEVSIDGFNVGKISVDRYNKDMDSKIDKVIIKDVINNEVRGDYSGKDVEIYVNGYIAVEDLKCRNLIMHGESIHIELNRSTIDNLSFDKEAIVIADIFGSTILDTMKIEYMTKQVVVYCSFVNVLDIQNSDDGCMVDIDISAVRELRVKTEHNLEVTVADSLICEMDVLGKKKIVLSTSGSLGESILKASVQADKFEYCGFNEIDEIDFKGLKHGLRLYTIGHLDDKYFNKRKQVVKVKANKISRVGNNLREIVKIN